MSPRGIPATSDCWHCSLLSYSKSPSSDSNPNMLQFTGYILPGIIFLCLGIRWAFHCTWDWSRKCLADDYTRASLPVPRPNYTLCPGGSLGLPWEGIMKLVLTGLGIIISVVLSSGSHEASHHMDHYVGNIRLSTVYLFFALSGLTDILVYYVGYSILPEGIQSFSLSVAFAVEGLIFATRIRFESYLEQEIHTLLVVDVFCCAATAAFEVLYDNRLIKFCRTYLCLVQGTWLIHGGFIAVDSSLNSQNLSGSLPESLEWIPILFAWHLAGHFILFTGVLLLVRSASKTDLFEHICCSFSLKMDPGPSLDTTLRTTPTVILSSTSSSSSSSRGSSHHKGTLRALPSIPRSSPHPPCTFSGRERALLARRIEPASPPVIVEAIPKDNISSIHEESGSLEEPYNSLNNNQDLRASIKLKESSLI
eukprot:TRINITY_DN1216_c1_g1_i1.p1 TRINITY_DN1216_c1_g1~~TRINITY_DN1216_c1_g1_i1.p1  ORF type:complete len:422 (+),score=126.35 TRINITY_DN1216_c1_g1_i1:159-1424(+)